MRYLGPQIRRALNLHAQVRLCRTTRSGDIYAQSFCSSSGAPCCARRTSFPGCRRGKCRAGIRGTSQHPRSARHCRRRLGLCFHHLQHDTDAIWPDSLSGAVDPWIRSVVSVLIDRRGSNCLVLLSKPTCAIPSRGARCMITSGPSYSRLRQCRFTCSWRIIVPVSRCGLI